MTEAEEIIKYNSLINEYMGTADVDYYDIDKIEEVAEKIRNGDDMELGDVKIMPKTSIIYTSGSSFHVHIKEGSKIKSAFIAIGAFAHYHKSKRNVAAIVFNNDHGEILLEYSKWLHNNGYLDTDWLHEAEGENAVEDFIAEKTKKR